MNSPAIKPKITFTEASIPGFIYAECKSTGRVAIAFQGEGKTYCYRFGDLEMKCYSPDEIEAWLCETD